MPKCHVIAGWVLSAWQHIKEDTACATWCYIAEAPAKSNKTRNDETAQAGGSDKACQSKLANQVNKEDNYTLLNNNFLSQPMSANKQDLFGFLI